MKNKMIFNGIIHKINTINYANNSYIELLCQDYKGKKIKIVDKSYHPYFRIILNKESNDLNDDEIMIFVDDLQVQIKEELKKLEEEINLIDIVFEKNKKYFSEVVNTLKVYYSDYVKTQKIVEVFEKIFENNKIFRGVVEDDIYIGLKYMVDKQFLFNHNLELEISDYSEVFETIFTNDIKKISMGELNRNFYNKICAFDIETEMTTKEINVEKNEIVSISFYNEDFKMVLISTKDSNSNLNQIAKGNEQLIVYKNEKDMLLKFWDLINEYFILIGYNSFNFDIKYIVERSIINEINLETLGIRYRKYDNSYKIENILHLDMYTYFRYFLSKWGNLVLDSYSLNNVSKKFLNKSKIDIETDFILSKMNKEEVEKLIEYNLNDSLLTYELFKRFELSIFDLLNIVALNLEDVTKSSASQIIEAFLVYNGQQEDYLVPRKPDNDAKGYRGSKYVTGAFVYKPDKGLFKDIYVYDFRSLYPSIISAYNICPTTLLTSIKGLNESQYSKAIMEQEIELQIGKVYFTNEKEGLIPKNIKKILKERFELKNQVKTAKGLEKEIMKSRSNSLKIIANSIYGYLGFEFSRWYSHDCAQAITAYARYFIKGVIEKISNFDCKIIYSDTDSVFFLKNNRTEKEVEDLILKLNSEFKDPIFLEKDGFFDSGLFVGVKKRYVLYSKEKDELKIVGFEAIRKDSTEIVRETQREIINLLLKEDDVEKAKKYFKDVVEDLRKNKINKRKLVITYKLSKDVLEYVQNAPHVMLAKNMIERGIKVKKGMVLRYVIEKGDGSIASRSRLIEDLKVYDSEYYINKHLVPSCKDFFSIFNIDVEKLISKQNDLSTFW